MSRMKVVSLVAVVVSLTLGLSSLFWAEDGNPGVFDIACGAGCGDILAKTRPNSLLTAIPGGTFVITVAHIAPSPEDAFLRNRPVMCEPVKFRVDALAVAAKDGSIEVKLGEQKELAAGQASRIVYTVDPQHGNGLRTFELDLMGFRLRSESPSSRCNVVAGGLFYADPFTTTPIPFALVPSAGPSSNAKWKVPRR